MHPHQPPRPDQATRRRWLQATGRTLTFAALAVAGLACASAASAQSWPTRTVTIVVPFPPAGGADSLARILGAHLSQVWKQTVVIENRPGAAGKIGAGQVARAPADGYTLLMSSTASLDLDNVKQFAPIALVSASPYVVTVSPRLGLSSVKELLARARAEPGKLTFGSSGDGSASHLSAELFKQLAGVDLLHVPYKGTGQAVNDLLGGTIDIMFAPGQTVSPHIAAGKLRALAVTSATRARAMPELPTLTEAGVPGYAAVGWFGLLAPAATPKALVAQLANDVNAALRDPGVEKTMLAAGAEPAEGTPDKFAKFILDELAMWARVTRQIPAGTSR
ncbi:MAG: tripartite tricarboxylate transporter substrate binding protein [Rubrivivax sp.]|nr:tripartite tricarboxylate transporter substrate binding protein [Rubrivivax sp.]